jgi:hypothetical protein
MFLTSGDALSEAVEEVKAEAEDMDAHLYGTDEYYEMMEYSKYPCAGSRLDLFSLLCQIIREYNIDEIAAALERASPELIECLMLNPDMWFENSLGSLIDEPLAALRLLAERYYPIQFEETSCEFLNNIVGMDVYSDEGRLSNFIHFIVEFIENKGGANINAICKTAMTHLYHHNEKEAVAALLAHCDLSDDELYSYISDFVNLREMLFENISISITHWILQNYAGRLEADSPEVGSLLHESSARGYTSICAWILQNCSILINQHE